jgi:DNA-directed RNA polymerase subunit L
MYTLKLAVQIFNQSIFSIDLKNKNEFTLYVNMLINMAINSLTLTIEEETHTVGNTLKAELLRDPRVLVAAYRQPHPLTRSVEVAFQTLDEDPNQVLQDTIDKILTNVDKFEEALENAIK